MLAFCSVYITIYLANYKFVDVNSCASNPCQANKTCVDGVNVYKCICPAGANGTTCEISKSSGLTISVLYP